MSPKDADGMANSIDPDKTAPLGAVWSGSALFVQAYLSENLGSLRYITMDNDRSPETQHAQKAKHVSHVTKKCVFGSLRPGKTQSGLLIYRD